jgi:hypothetical protein
MTRATLASAALVLVSLAGSTGCSSGYHDSYRAPRYHRYQRYAYTYGAPVVAVNVRPVVYVAPPPPAAPPPPPAPPAPPAARPIIVHAPPGSVIIINPQGTPGEVQYVRRGAPSPYAPPQYAPPPRYHQPQQPPPPAAEEPEAPEEPAAPVAPAAPAAPAAPRQQQPGWFDGND